MIRCKKCHRFTSNNQAEINPYNEHIRNATGDCTRCGTEVPVMYDAWEDWGWTDDDMERMATELAKGAL